MHSVRSFSILKILAEDRSGAAARKYDITITWREVLARCFFFFEKSISVLCGTSLKARARLNRCVLAPRLICVYYRSL